MKRDTCNNAINVIPEHQSLSKPSKVPVLHTPGISTWARSRSALTLLSRQDHMLEFWVQYSLDQSLIHFFFLLLPP